MRNLISVLGGFLLVFVWLGVKYFFEVPDRYLPSLEGVGHAIVDIGPELAGHTASTALRIIVGFAMGLVTGLGLALGAYRLHLLPLLLPAIHSLRSIPPVATVPFFLMWFGFSEIGKFLLIACGLGLNIAAACIHAIENLPERDRILFKSFDIDPRHHIQRFWLPRLGETLLPTLRFGLATAVGLVVVAEMLGSQSGLGYLIQTSRATFSLNVIFLATAILAVITIVADKLIVAGWQNVIYWRQ